MLVYMDLAIRGWRQYGPWFCLFFSFFISSLSPFLHFHIVLFDCCVIIASQYV